MAADAEKIIVNANVRVLTPFDLFDLLLVFAFAIVLTPTNVLLPAMCGVSF